MTRLNIREFPTNYGLACERGANKMILSVQERTDKNVDLAVLNGRTKLFQQWGNGSLLPAKGVGSGSNPDC